MSRTLARPLLCLGMMLLALYAPADAALGKEPAVPESSAFYRAKVERAAAEYFGLDAPSARIAAQLHQESLWRPDARSKYAVGISQFTPGTAAWLPSVCPELGQFDPWDAGQAIRGAACYDAWLHQRVGGATACDRWAFTLSAYNGGLGWVQRDKDRASATGADPLRWFGHVDAHSPRAAWAIRENRHYVDRILLRLEPAYIRAGWPGVAVCP